MSLTVPIQYCNTSPADMGSHTVASIVSDKWLAFSAERGNDLRPILSDNCRWCLCASRWKESFDAWKRGDISKDGVPRWVTSGMGAQARLSCSRISCPSRVVLSATHQQALSKIPLEDLKAFAVDAQDPSQGGPIR